MRSALGKENLLQTIRIHKSELKNILFKKDGKEISFNGEMYDIKSKYFDGDYIVFHLKYDKKETKLLAGLNKHVQYNSDAKSSSEKKQNNKNPVKDLFFMKNNISVLHSSDVIFPDFICHLPSYVLPVNTLPPKISFS